MQFLLQPQVLDTPIKRKDNTKGEKVIPEGTNCSKWQLGTWNWGFFKTLDQVTEDNTALYFLIG